MRNLETYGTEINLKEIKNIEKLFSIAQPRILKHTISQH